MDFLTTSQLANRLRISPRRVCFLIGAGRIAATKIGWSHVIAAAEADRFAGLRRQPGRPARHNPQVIHKRKSR